MSKNLLSQTFIRLVQHTENLNARLKSDRNQVKMN